MGRELRKVPKDWQHPKGNDGRYQPMHDEDFETAAKSWKEGYAKWESDPSSCDGMDRDYEYWEYDLPPDRDYYRPKWTDEERTHFQMYETTSEGSPIPPVFETVEELCRWLAATSASAFADMTATYEEWMAMCADGSSFSAVAINGELMSGVAFAASAKDGGVKTNP